MKNFFIALGHAAAGGAAAAGLGWFAQGNLTDWKTLVFAAVGSAITSAASLYTNKPGTVAVPATTATTVIK